GHVAVGVHADRRQQIPRYLVDGAAAGGDPDRLAAQVGERLHLGPRHEGEQRRVDDRRHDTQGGPLGRAVNRGRIRVRVLHLAGELGGGHDARAHQEQLDVQPVLSVDALLHGDLLGEQDDGGGGVAIAQRHGRRGAGGRRRRGRAAGGGRGAGAGRRGGRGAAAGRR